MPNSATSPSTGPVHHRFGKEDIGAQLLPILTSGLYRDTLDTLREYIQNAIDARSTQINMSITRSVVSVADNGVGMTEDQARQAIRLGMSDKNSRLNVGFRGIGVYSAFNLCNSLSIYTRAGSHETPWLLRFNFRGMREDLAEEQERKEQGLPPQLYLELLLNRHVSVGG